MRLPAVQLKVLIGPNVPAPAPPWLLTAIESVTVIHDVEQRSGFEIILRIGRGRREIADYRAFQYPLLQIQNRVILVVLFGTHHQVLMDGIITQRQFTPGNLPGEGRLTLQGEDLTVLMDQEEVVRDYSQQSDPRIVQTVLNRYRHLGIVPRVERPDYSETPSRNDRVPMQHSTDLKLLQSLAARHGFVFFLEPGPTPKKSIAYWGPPVRETLQQKPLRVNMGPDSNAEITSFHYDSLAPVQVRGGVWDAKRRRGVPIQASPKNIAQKRVSTALLSPKAYTQIQATARAHGEVKSGNRQHQRVSGTLDASRYLSLLRVHTRVEVQGAGRTHDGLYDVLRVTHQIRQGSYTQTFELALPESQVGGGRWP